MSQPVPQGVLGQALDVKNMRTVGTKRHCLLFVLPLLLLSGCAMEPADKEFFYKSWTRPAGSSTPLHEPAPQQP